MPAPISPPRPSAPPPVLRVTRYEQVSSLLMAILGGMAVTVILLAVAWFSSRVPPPVESVPVELIEFPGGVEDGAVDETLRVDSPAPESPDASPAEFVAEEREFQESLDNVLELADDAVEQAERQFETGMRSAGKAGSASGTGKRPLGSGKGTGGFPREERWYIRYGDQQSLEEYAKQLDFFGIEFGAIVGNQLVYVSKLALAQPVVRRVPGGAAEKRLFMTWQGGSRKQADLQLFRKAGIEVGSGIIFHFYPKDTEDRLARLELAYKKRKATEIRRTYFTVEKAEGGYSFVVIRQTYLK